jgi:hypothetical protein
MFTEPYDAVATPARGNRAGVTEVIRLSGT